MAPICGVCNKADSKYRCPTCDLRYCSITCYKPHKAEHEAAQVAQSKNAAAAQQSSTASTASKLDRPGTTQRVPKFDFTGFETDKDFQRLLTRYPKLRYQLQLIYGVTMEPGPDEARSWSRQNWYISPRDRELSGRRGRGRGRFRGGRGWGRGAYFPLPHDRLYESKAAEDVQHGPWTEEKGDKEGLDLARRMRDSSEVEHMEGMSEFAQLCQLKFGSSS